MSELESLNLEHADLRTVTLEPPSDSEDPNGRETEKDAALVALGRGRLKELRLLGNPLKCDCHARDARHSARSGKADLLRSRETWTTLSNYSA